MFKKHIKRRKLIEDTINLENIEESVMKWYQRSLILGGILLASAAAFKPSQASSALWEISASSLRRCYALPLRTSLFSVPIRFYSSSTVLTGCYAQVTEDVAFKHIMHKESLRNSFLGAVLGQKIHHSEILDTSLNPIKEFDSPRKVINKSGIEDIMKEISSGQKKPKITNIKTKRSLPTLETFLGELALHYHQLLHAIPGAERNTQLDLVCETKDGLVNIEIQVEPQNFWDIRILAHVCGLFQRQFPRSFGWSQLEEDPTISHKVRRAIGVSIFEKAPVHQSAVHALLPWYDSKPWEREELRRHFQLTEQTNKTLKRPGIEFFDFNLEAVSSRNSSLSQQPIELQEWLDFLAKAHYKKPEEIQGLKTPELKEAYHMAELDSWDEKLKAEYREQQAKRHNISHYVKGEKQQAREEVRLEAALKMLRKNISDSDILEISGITPEQLAALKNKPLT